MWRTTIFHGLDTPHDSAAAWSFDKWHKLGGIGHVPHPDAIEEILLLAGRQKAFWGKMGRQGVDRDGCWDEWKTAD